MEVLDLSKYDVDLKIEDRDSVYLIAKHISNEAKVLEFGSASGTLTKYLSEEKQCNVTIVEIDEVDGRKAAEYADRSFIGKSSGDIENYTWYEELKYEKFDFIIFADVLEHLRNPEKAIKYSKFLLGKNASILISVPNMAHNSIIIDMINDNINYQNIGLLDDTHIKWFTYKSLSKMIQNCGLKITSELASYGEVGDIEVSSNYYDIPIGVGKHLKKRKYGEIYQFVFRVQDKHDDVVIEKNIKFQNKYNLELFIKGDKETDFTEMKKISRSISPDGNCTLEFDLSSYKEISMIRIDPLDTNCIIKVNCIEIDGVSINICDSYVDGNYSFKIDSVLFFETTDPQLVIKTMGENINIVHINIDFYDYDIENWESFKKIYNGISKKLLNYETELNKCKSDNEALESKINSLTDLNNITTREIEKMRLDSNRKNGEYRIQVEHYDERIAMIESEKHEIKQLLEDALIDRAHIETEYNKLLEKFLLTNSELDENKKTINSILNVLHNIKGYFS